MSAPTCKQCGERPASKDGKKSGKQRYRAVCGRCRWDHRMEDIRDERTALYKAAQQSEVKMLAERRLRLKLDESVREWVKVADERLVLIQNRDSDIGARDMEIASLKEQFAKLTADYDAVLQHKWEWMQKHNRLAAKAEECERQHAATKARIKGFIQAEMKRLAEIRGLQAAHEGVTAELEEKKGTVVDLKAEIDRLDERLAEQKESAQRRYKRLLEASGSVEAQMRAKLTESLAWGRKATTVLAIGILILLAALGFSVLS